MKFRGCWGKCQSKQENKRPEDFRTYPKIRATPTPPGDKSPGYPYKVRLSGLNSRVLAVLRQLWMNSPDINVRAGGRKNFVSVAE
jgi:hypothetical protein